MIEDMDRGKVIDSAINHLHGLLSYAGISVIDKLSEIQYSRNAVSGLWLPAIAKIDTAAQRALHQASQTESPLIQAQCICYPANMLLIGLAPDNLGYGLYTSVDGQIFGVASRAYLELPDIPDPVDGETVSIESNIKETLRIAASAPNPLFTLLLFLTLAEDKELPLYGDQFGSISTHFGGVGSIFSGDTETGYGVMLEKYFTKVGVKGVAEILNEELYPWHARCSTWSAWKEGITWLLLERHTGTHPCEQKVLKGLIEKHRGIKLTDFKTLVYNWPEIASRTDPPNSPIFAYYSGEIAFLTLAAKSTGDEEFKAENYPRYLKSLEKLCEQITADGIKGAASANPGIMLPYVIKWGEFESEDDLFSYVNAKMADFSASFLKFIKFA